jgi:hypothetical protein
LESFKEKLLKKIQPIHIYHQQKVIDEKEENEASAIEAEIEEKECLLKRKLKIERYCNSIIAESSLKTFTSSFDLYAFAGARSGRS